MRGLTCLPSLTLPSVTLASPTFRSLALPIVTPNVVVTWFGPFHAPHAMPKPSHPALIWQTRFPDEYKAMKISVYWAAVRTRPPAPSHRPLLICSLPDLHLTRRRRTFVTPSHAIARHRTSSHAISRRLTPSDAISRHLTPSHAVTRHRTPSHASQVRDHMIDTLHRTQNEQVIEHVRRTSWGASAPPSPIATYPFSGVAAVSSHVGSADSMMTEGEAPAQPSQSAWLAKQEGEIEL